MELIDSLRPLHSMQQIALEMSFKTYCIKTAHHCAGSNNRYAAGTLEGLVHRIIILKDNVGEGKACYYHLFHSGTRINRGLQVE